MNRFFRSIVLIFLSFSFSSTYSQISTCFEIESILVDACGASNTEGLNEMVRFRTGPNPLNITNMTVNWATTTNPWLGICQNTVSAQKVSAINQSIQSCGQVIEPPQGIIPPNSIVILVTSVNMDPLANSFAGLSETVYMIFQCGNTTTGHFANFGAGSRTLTISFSSPANCSDQVTYDRSQLVNQAGNPGAGDGGTVNFTPAGVASYTNNGCNAPFVPISAAWTLTNGGVICENAQSVNLNALITGVQGGVWTGNGVTGSTFNPAGLSGITPVTYSVVQGACSLAVTQNFNVIATPTASLSTPSAICQFEIFNLNSILTGTPGGVFTANSGQLSGSNFSAQIAGIYTITYTVGTSGCSSTASVDINVGATPDAPLLLQNPEPVCVGQIVTAAVDASQLQATTNWYSNADLTGLVLSGNNTYSFPLNASSTIYVVSTSNNNGCNSSVLSIPLTVIDSPNAPQIAAEFTFCEGSAIPTLTVSGTGGNTVQWFNDANLQSQIATGVSFTPLVAGNYFVTQQAGLCASLASPTSVTEIPLVQADISINGNLNLCNGETVQLVSGSTSGNSWNIGGTSQIITVSETAEVILSVTGLCNVATDTVQVTAQTINASFSATPNQLAAPATVALDITASSGNCDWTVNGNPIVPQNNSLSFDLPGEYLIVHTCEGTNNCSDTQTQTITLLNNNIELTIPNSFTPNGDGFNDLFVVKMQGITEAQLTIFNRWGNKVHEQKGLSLNWDGIHANNQSPDGVYFYIVTAKDVFGKELQKNGYIYLARQPTM